MSNLFEAKSPLGVVVVCPDETWFNHVIVDNGHPIMDGNVENVIAAIESPDAIFKSDQTQNRDVYFKLTTYNIQGINKRLYTKVVVENDSTTAVVKSAWPQNTMSGGIGGVVYVKPKL